MNFEQLAIFELAFGDHESAEQGLCAMEAVAWLEGLPHSDRPACTCPVIGAFVRIINDSMPDGERQKLIPYLPHLVGTVAPEFEQARAEYLAWHAITVITPNALDEIGLAAHAAKLRGLQEHDWAAARAAARSAARAARAADAAWAGTDAAWAATDAARAAWTATVAADAARAATEAAWAAWAATGAAEAARAARAATEAAWAATEAAWAGEAAWNPALQMLDGVLTIGPQSPGFSKPVAERVVAYRELVMTR